MTPKIKPMKTIIFLRILLSVILIEIYSAGYSQNTVSGRLLNESNEPLIGASIMVESTTKGVSSDTEGYFEILTELPFPITLIFSYVGYKNLELEVNAPTSNLIVILKQGLLLNEEVVITASRRREKIQEAPSSISVITAKQMEASPNDNPLRNLIKEPGVIIQQQTAGRINIHLRGDDGLVYGSASYPMLDYMPLALSGDFFQNLGTPVNNIDLDRIEVVRGPGSALYGPGVTAGIIHFISKSAIDKPGSTFELLGGELSTYGISIRHATKVSEKFGFKINAFYKRGGEFTLNPDNPQDALQIAKLQNTVSVPTIVGEIQDPTLPARLLLDSDDLDPDGDGNPMQDYWKSNLISATMEFRPKEDFSVVLSGAMNNASSVFYNASGEGLGNDNIFWTQARVQKGGFFGQVSYKFLNGGTDDNPSWLYQTGTATSVVMKWLEAQAQYNFETPRFLDAQWTIGFDNRTILSDTKNQVNGRFENDDDFIIRGGYLQTKLPLNPKLDLVLAGRLDRFSYLNETSFAPRAVFVYKPNPKHTIRAGFNRAVGTPGIIEIFPDLPLASIIPGAFDIWYIGNKNRQTFGEDPQIVFNGVLPFPSLPAETPGLPLAYAQGAVSGEVLPVLVEDLAAYSTLAPFVPTIIEYLSNPANFVDGTVGTFAGINLLNNLPLEILDAPSASLRIEDTWELGYKGLIGNKLGISVDVYNRNVDGGALFTAISPSYTLLDSKNIPSALGRAVQNDLSTFLTELLSPHLGSIFPDEASLQDAVNQISDLVGGSYEQAGSGFLESIQPLIDGAILAATPTEQVPDNGVTHVATGFRTFERFNYWGIDFGMNYYLNNSLTLSASYSWISKNLFNPKIVDVDGTESITLLQPSYRFRLGLNYAPDFGFRTNLSYQFDPSFNVLLGQYTGDTDVKSLIDAGIGYKFNNSLMLDISAQNLFDNEYRTYPNFPKIGRRVLGKITYTFGN
jgi:iron complex outermembrane receptor protein